MKKGIKSRVAAAVTAVAMVLGGVGLTAPKMSKAAEETYQTIIGSSIPYGIVSNKLDQGNTHMETTFATNIYKQGGSQANEIDLCALLNVGIIVGELDGGNGVFFGEKHPTPGIQFKTTSEVLAKSNVNNVKDKPGLVYTEVIKTKAEIKTEVDGFIDNMKNKSDSLASHTATFTTTQLKNGTSDFKNIVIPEAYANQTVYVSVDATATSGDDKDFIDALAGSGNIVIKKPESTVVVFNITGDRADGLKLNKIVVNGCESHQDCAGNRSAHNNDVDSKICQKICWNFVGATKIELDTTAGMFLVKNPASTVTQRNTAGWILSAGTVKLEGEFHYIYQGNTDPNGAPIPPTANFQFDKYDPDKICLEGAEFTLYTDATCTTPYYKAGEPYKVKSDANGVCKFTGVVEGTYYLKETETVAGFNINTNIYKVLIEGSDVKFGEGVDSTPSLTSLEVVNDPITAALEVTVIDEKTGDIVPGVKIKIKKPNGKEEDKITDSKGKVEYPKAPIGNYTITVTEVPEGYSVTVGSTLTPEVKVGDNPKKVEAKIANKNDGSNTPGGNTPGGNTPGGNTPGGNTPGGNTPGGNTPGGSTPGGNGSGAGGNSIVPGGNTAGGTTNTNKADSASVVSNTSKNVSGTPAMGDAMNVTLFVGVMILAMALAAGMIVLRKKED